MSDLFRKRLAHRLADLFDQHRVVVWHDDSGVLDPLLREVLPPGVEMPYFTGNPLSLRQAIDGDDPWLEKKWLLYVPPLADGFVCEWLADYEQGFRALVQANFAWTLRELFGMPETAELRRVLRGPAATTLSLRFGQYFPTEPERLSELDVLYALVRAAIDRPAADEGEIVLRFLTSDDDVARWTRAELLATLTTIVKERLGLRRHLTDGQPPDRGALARCLVASALVESEAADAKPLANHLPQEAFRPRWSDTLARGLQDAVRRSALDVAVCQGLQGSDLVSALSDAGRLARGPALPLLDAHILELLYQQRPPGAAPTEAWWDEISSVTETRLKGEALDESLRARWLALRAAANLLRAAQRRIAALVTYPADGFDRLANEYVRREDGDWRLDQLYRALPQAAEAVPEEWRLALIEPARSAYHRVVREIATHFVKSLEVKGSYGAAGFIRQTKFWGDLVDTGGKTAVLLIDALRADLAWELATMLEARGREVGVCFALAELPTRTEVGMAALLPRAHGEFTVSVENGKLVSRIGATRLPGPTERSQHLVTVLTQQGKAVRRESLAVFLRDDGKLLTESFADGAVVVAHTLDLDDGGEIAATVTFQVFTEVLRACATLIDRALAAGFTEVVVGSDHGFLLRDPQAAPGGVPGTGSASGGFARGLRFAAGVGQVGTELVRLSAGLLGREGEDVYVPRDTAHLALQGGPRPFMHGGLSPQECALVFLRVRPGQQAARLQPVPVTLRVPERVTALTFTVTLVATAVRTPLLVAQRGVYLIVRDASGSAVWQTREPMVFSPGDLEQAQTVILTVPRGGGYTVSAQDAESGAPLYTLPVHVEVLGEGIDF